LDLPRFLRIMRLSSPREMPGKGVPRSRQADLDPITFTDQRIEIDAGLIARGLRMEPETLRTALRDGRVTRTVEKGEGEDAGRYRVTFYAPTRRLRLLFTDKGEILQTSSAPYSRKARPPAP
jgi:hypothetical protein